MLNQDNKATFCPNDDRNIQSHIDLTLCTPNISKLIKKWEVSDDDSMSDHKAINFSMEINANIQKEETISKRKTDWNKYKNLLSEFNSKLNLNIEILKILVLSL